LNESNQHYIEISIQATPDVKLLRQHQSPQGIADSPLQECNSNTWISLRHNDLVTLEVDEVVASIRIDLSPITRIQESNDAVVASSDYHTQYHTPQPQLSKSASVIGETPAVSRIAIDILLGNEDILSNSEPQSDTEAPHSKKRQLVDEDEDLPTAKRSRASTPTLEQPNKKRGRPRKSDENSSDHAIKEDLVDSTKSAAETSKSRQKHKIVVVFSGSSHPQRPETLKFLKKFAQIKDEVTPEIDFLCVGKGELKKTSKVLRAVIFGKPIVDDKWVTACLKAKGWVDPMEHVAHDGETEKRFKVPSTWSLSRGTEDLLKNKIIYATPAVKKDMGASWKEFVSVNMATGASKVVSYPVHNKAEDIAKNYPDWICIGEKSEDVDAYELLALGAPVFNKDLLSWGILRGKVNLDSKEFRYAGVTNPSKPKKEMGVARR
jgi:hypothetical protein